MDEQTEQIVTSLHNLLKKIAETDTTELARREELGEALHFGDAVELLKHPIELARTLRQFSLESMPTTTLTSLTNTTNKFLSALEALKDFSLDALPAVKPRAVRDQLLVNAKACGERFMQGWIPWLAYLDRDIINHSQVQEAWLKKLQDIEEQLERTRKEIDAKNRSLTDVLTAAKEAAGVVGVSEHEQIFEKETMEQAATGRIWLKVT